MSSFVPHPLDDSFGPLGGEPSHRQRPQDSEETHLKFSEMLQVASNTILATLYFVITLLFHFMTCAVPDPLDNTISSWGEEPSSPERPQDPGDTRLNGIQRVAITSIRATGLALGLRRIPAGFHVTVQTDDAEWQTSNKPVHVDQDVLEWNEQILLPCEPSSRVRVRVYASFELDPMLGHGELLRTVETCVRELLDRSGNSHSIIFQPKQGEVISSCTSLLMTTAQPCHYEDDSLVHPITPPTPCDMGAFILKTDGGHYFLARYRRTQNCRDLDRSVKHFECAVDFCPVDHPYRPAALFNLATAKLLSCQANGTYIALDIPTSLFEKALDMRPTGHPDRAITQLHLAIALLSRFAKWQSQTDANVAGELLNEVFDVCHANSHVYRAALLSTEASALYSTRSTNANNVETEAQIAPMLPGSPNELARRANLCLERDDPHALDDVISLHYDALGYYSTTHARRVQLLGNLGVMLCTRFERQGNNQDAHEAIALHREVLALCPVGHPDRSVSLDRLANGLCMSFRHRGNDQALDEAIVLQREALALRPVGHPDRSKSLHNLGFVLSTRFHYRGNAQDLDDAIVLHSEELALHPVGHPHRPMPLHNLGAVLSTRFYHRGNDQDLDAAIVLHSEELALYPTDHPHRSTSLQHLGDLLSTRFKHRGNDKDLDEAIVFQTEALGLYSVGHSDRASSLNDLGLVLSTRFDHRGNDQDLDEAIVLQREALALLPVGHPVRSASLNNLALVLSTRFEHRGNVQDLDEVIVLLREAQALLPDCYPEKSMLLNNLATRLSARFEHRRDDQDLDEAIKLHSEALVLRPVGHPDRSMSLNNLANLLSARFEHRRNDQDLDEAIVLHQQALALRPVGHTGRSMSLNDLGNQLSTRFEHQGNAQDLNESLENSRCALMLLTQHDPRQLAVHRSLATVYLQIHQLGGEGTDSLDAAMHHFKAAANVASGGLLFRLRASLRWVHYANQHIHGTELEAYATSMQLLDAYMSATASVSSRHNAMKNPDFPNTLAVDAASCALRRGDVRRAVELLEQGRTLIWTQMARFRTPLDSLQERGGHAQALMKKFQDLSSLLDKPPANHLEGKTRVDVEAEDTRYRRLVEDWNTSAEDLRKIEGFTRFLLPPLFSDLQDAARDGPIIVLLASKSSCNAIIVPRQEPPVIVGLAINVENLERLVNALQQTVKKEEGKQGKLIDALRQLWVEVVHPVVENLGRVAKPGSRIWWCPTSFFNFLPLHAAGEYRSGGKSLSQFYISSYTPSLTALIKARRSHDRALPVSFAAIGQNHPPEHKFPLIFVEPELELVQSLLPPSPTVSFTKVTSAESTKLTALRTLRDNHWIHFACHGTQNFAEPFKSAFLMGDQPLQLLDISHMGLSQHEFAFLSACETAVGDAETPDEVIHLAAGLQFSGVKSVIGTFWNVNDSTVQRLVAEFYKNFCGDGKMNSKRAARALHKAVRTLASSDENIPLDQRIVFMHIGL
ncbi:CHAT domain-containing protein [Suillus paluster]|uniref:CHAT domain-containing protein n=1 Tax=Suillus paluster TaxID=48578 RepID=UPI001B86AD1C|nr:CHAT domain-containing protein [Suillus paluster]KAG1722691.1 CHAT domain-containing protein [Suillus paluster]